MENLGRHHPAIRRLRTLRRDAARRRAEGLFLAEGFHLAEEALRSRTSIEEALVSPRTTASKQGRRLLEALQHRGVPCRATAASVLDSLQDARSPQPILLLVKRAEWTLERACGARAGPPLITVAHAVQDPGNLGALLRSTDAAGGTALLTSGRCADLHHQRTVRASMGSIFRLPALEVELSDLLRALEDRGVRRIAADPSAGELYHACDLRGPTAIFLGGEGAGLPADLLRRLDGRMHVPMRRGVMLFEAARQRGDLVSPEATTDGE
jgi:TrmH family RNA methyltransferase